MLVNVSRSLAVCDTPISQGSMDGFAVGDVGVRNAAVGLGIAVLGFKQRTTTQLFLLDVLK